MKRMDPEALDALRVLDAGEAGTLLRERLEDFLQNAPIQLQDMDSFLQEGKTHELAEAAESLRNSAAELGANELGELCARLAMMARSEAVLQAATIVERIYAEVREVEAEIHRLPEMKKRRSTG